MENLTLEEIRKNSHLIKNHLEIRKTTLDLIINQIKVIKAQANLLKNIAQNDISTLEKQHLILIKIEELDMTTYSSKEGKEIIEKYKEFISDNPPKLIQNISDHYQDILQELSHFSHQITAVTDLSEGPIE